MRILNLYAGIGGNRKLWPNVDITAVEFNPKVAAIYKHFYPSDEVIVGDAHQYLLAHFKEYDFIWLSYPCQSHTRLNTASFPKGSKEYVFPDLKLYEEIIFLKHFFYGKFSAENVIPYYQPLIEPTIEIDRHLFWTNFEIEPYQVETKKRPHIESEVPYLQQFLGFDLTRFNISNKRQLLRNCVVPEIGLHILNAAFPNGFEKTAAGGQKINYDQTQMNLFSEHERSTCN